MMDFTCCVVCMWCCLDVVLSVGSIVYMLCMWHYVHVCVMYMSCLWCCVHVVLCTHFIGDVVCMWHYLHVVQVVSCTCDIVNTLRRWCLVHVMLCTCYAGGVVYRWYCVHVAHMVLVYMWYFFHVIHVMLWACGTMYVHCVIMAS